jgi:recombination protein RecA
MARKKKEEDLVEEAQGSGEKAVSKAEDEKELLHLTKTLIRTLNKEGEDKMAWCLATDKDNPTDVKDFISTGSTLLDYIISNRRGGGIAMGKITEVVGEEASGKSLLVTHVLANTQKKGGLAVYIDEENALNPDFAQRVGLDLKKLVYLQCGYVEKVGETIESIIIKAREKDVSRPITIVWDSVAATPPKAELEGDYDPNSRIGLQAKAIAKMMRKLTTTVGREKVTLVFTNQLKVKIGVMFGDPMGTSGGKAIPYHASTRIRLTRSTEEKDATQKDMSKGQTYGVNTYAKIIKNRLGPPMRRCEFTILFASGIDDEESWFNYLHSVGEISKQSGFCYMSNVPQTVVVDKEGKEEVQVAKELKFREKAWKDIVADPATREHVFGLLDKHLIVKYDAKEIKDLDIDPESLMDAEAMAEMVVEETPVPQETAVD